MILDKWRLKIKIQNSKAKIKGMDDDSSRFMWLQEMLKSGEKFSHDLATLANLQNIRCFLLLRDRSYR